MTAQELMSLAERCEAATGADARLGAEIEIAVRGFPERAYAQKNAMRPRGAPELDRLEWAASFFGPGPTASLDAAMTLVPEGCLWHVTNTSVEEHFADLSRATALVGYPDETRDNTVEAATPALALVAAALRARAQQEN